MFGNKRLVKATEMGKECAWFREQILMSNASTDPIERIQKLEKMGKIIDAKINAKHIEERSKLRSTNKLTQGVMMSLATGLFLAGVAISATSGVVLVPISSALIGIVGFVLGTDKIANFAKKRLETKNSQFLNTLNNQKSILSRMVDRVMKNNIQDINNSPKLNKIFENPTILKAFAKASGRKISEIKSAMMLTNHLPLNSSRA